MTTTAASTQYDAGVSEHGAVGPKEDGIEISVTSGRSSINSPRRTSISAADSRSTAGRPR
jgi:hypothetical protein